MPSRTNLRSALGVVCLSWLCACGGGGGSSSGGGGGGGGGGGSGNAPPGFAGPTDFVFAETALVSFTLTVTDPDSPVVTIRSLTGGDAALFVLDTASGVITANTRDGLLDFENPQDADGDNVYTQDVELSDGTNTIRDTITVTITNVDEGPEFPILDEVPLNENFTGDLLTFTATDPEGAAVTGYRIVEVTKLGEVVNADRLVNAFELDPATGVLRVVTAFDAELEGTQDRINIAVVATDGAQVGGGGVSLRLVDLPSRLTGGIRISGEQALDRLGEFAGEIGDVDGDGIPEVWVAADSDEAGQEYAFLLWGSALRARLAAGASDQSIADYPAGERIRVLGDLRAATPRRSLLVAVSAGDVDGDGFSDVLVLLRELRSFGQIEEVDNGPVAVLLWGSDLASRRPETLDLNRLPGGAGVQLGGLARPFAARIVASHADLDQDGRSDLLLGMPERNRSLVVFGDALSPASGAFDLGAADNSAVVVIQSELVGRGLIQQTGSVVEAMTDVTGDGVPELVIAGEGLEPDLENGVFVLDGGRVAAAKGNAVFVNLSGAGEDGAVIEMVGADLTVDSIDAGGDVDDDGLADIAIGHYGRFGGRRVASVVTGARLQALFGTDAELDLDFASATQGLAIVDTGFDPMLVGEEGRAVVRWLPSVTGGPGSDLAIGVGKAYPLDRSDAGHVLLLDDSTLRSSPTPTLTIDSAMPAAPGVRVLRGYGAGVQTGRSLFVVDLDGDGLSELGTASSAAGRDGGPRDAGGLVIARGTLAEDAFTQADGAVDLAAVFVVESP